MSQKKTKGELVAASLISPNLNLQEIPAVDETGYESTLEKVFSSYSLDSNTIEFLIQPSCHFTDLKNSLLFFAGHLKKTGTSTAVGETAGPANNFLASAFLIAKST